MSYAYKITKDEYGEVSLEEIKLSLNEKIRFEIDNVKSRIINKLNPPKMDLSIEEIEYLKSLANDEDIII